MNVTERNAAKPDGYASRLMHRTGPPELEPGPSGAAPFVVQRCLRCDTVLNIVRPGAPELKLGGRVAGRARCPRRLT